MFLNISFSIYLVNFNIFGYPGYYPYIYYMEILSREGSQVIIKDKNGRTWLTRRVKRKKDSRRRPVLKCTVRYIPIRELF